MSAPLRRFKLARYFALLSMILLVLSGSLLANFIRNLEIDETKHQAEERNATMTQLLGNLLQEDIEGLMAASTGKNSGELQTLAAVEQLNRRIETIIRGSDIVKVKIYNPQGLTVFSTEKAQIGEDRRVNPGFISAKNGKAFSELVHRDKFSASEGIIENVDLVSSYIRFARNGEVLAVFEQYQHVDKLIRQVDDSVLKMVAATALVFAILYFLLFWVVRHAEKIVKAQEERLEAANRDLDRRVEERTHALQESEARFRSLTEMSSDFYWETDADHRFTMRTCSQRESVDPVFQQKAFIGMLRWEVPYVSPDEVGWQLHRAMLEAHQPFRDFEISRYGVNGSILHVSVSGDPIFDADSRFCGYRGIGRDITERKQAEEKIQHLAFYDQLTGLANRPLLVDRLYQAQATGEVSVKYSALMIIDLDNFKTLNDTQGHDLGDILLRQVGARLQQYARHGDTVARVGGDEFAIILNSLDAAHVQDAIFRVESFSQKLLGALALPYALPGLEFHVAASAGITLFKGSEISVDNLLRQADLAMYQAKKAGGNGYAFFDAGMDHSAQAHARMENDLRNALREQQFELHYQPQVNDRTGEVAGAEALIRWNHPERGMVSPVEFIPHAERTGLIIKLGQWVLETACQHLAAWARSPANSGLVIAVNVSAQQFQSPDFYNHVTAALERSGADPRQLKLELTESVFAGDVDSLIELMRRIKALGIGFSLDDFGTGYSSLSYLSRLPLDQLKIDRSFVGSIESGDNNVVICSATIGLAHSLKLKVVAEGVENDAQRHFLSTVHGCDLLQGYLYSRPLAHAAFERWLDQFRTAKPGRASSRKGELIALYPSKSA